MNDIVSKSRGIVNQDGFILNIINGDVYCTSNELAKQFEKRHDKVLEKIDKEIERFVSLSRGSEIYSFFRESDYITERGRTYKRYDLTFKGFQMIALTYNDKKAFKNRLDFINAFEILLKTVSENKLTAKINNKDSIWLEIRNDAKLARTKFTDVLQEVFMPQRIKENKETSQFLQRYITSFTTHVVYAKLDIKTPTGVKINRDTFSAKTIIRVELLEEQIKELIYKYKDTHYKEIYKKIKEEILS